MADTFGSVLRGLRSRQGLSLNDVARRCHCSRGYVSELEHDSKRPSPEFAKVVDEALDAGGRLIASLLVVAPETGPAQPWEIAELVSRVRRSDIDGATLDMLSASVDHLCGEYSSRPAADLRADAQRWLFYICTRLEGGRVSLAAHRDLLVSAGWLTLLIGSLEHDLGYQSAALATRAAALHLGQEAGQSEIVGWAHELKAWISLTSNDPRAALQAAQAGQEARQGGHATVQLIAHEAKALSRLGDGDGVRSAIDRGASLVAELPPTIGPHHFRPDSGKFRFLAMDCYRHVGDNEAAAAAARRVIAGTDIPAGRLPSAMRQAEAWLTVGVVAARNGQLDEATMAGTTALECGPRRSLPSLLLAAKELDDELRARYPGEPETNGFTDQLRTMGSGSSSYRP